MKKFLSSLLCVMLIVTMMPAAAFADGEAAVGEYRFEVGLPSQQTAWIPGINSGFWTNLEHYIEDEWGGRYWDRTDDYTVEVTAVPAPGHCENCADAEDWIVIDYHDSGRGFDLEITQEYPIGCSVDVTVKAMVDETCVAEESFMIDVTDTMYTINCENDFPDQTEMGTVIEFCGNILLKKWTIAENGEKTVTVINEEGANLPYQVVMDYDEASWIPDGDEIHGLCNLQKITPYGASAVIHLLIDGETVASSDFGVGGYEYRVEWMSDGTPHMFISEESVTVPLEKSDDLTAAENCELSFKLGVWEDDHVEPFAAQTGLCEVTEDGNGIILYPAAIAAVLEEKLEEDGEAWFEIQPYVTCNGVTAAINQSRDCLLLESRVEFDYRMDEEQYLLPEDEFHFEKEVRANVRNEEYPDWEELWLEITDVSVDNEEVACLTQWEDEGGWSVKAISPGTATLTITHQGIGDGAEPITKDIPINVERDLWRTDLDYVNRTEEGGRLKVTLQANARHVKYQGSESYETGEDYLVVWDIHDQDNVGAEIIDENNETVTVTCEEIDSGFLLEYEIYEAGTDLNDESAEPVDSGSRWIHMDQTFYTFEVPNFDGTLEMEETAEVEFRVVRHFMDGGELKTETAEAEFFYDDFGSETLNVETSEEDGVFRMNISRNNTGSAEIWVDVNYCDSDNDIWWQHEIKISELKAGVSEETDKFYAYKLENGEYVRMNNVPVDGEEGYPAFFAGESSDNAFYVLWKAEGDVAPEDLQLNIFETEGWDNRYVKDIDDGCNTGLSAELQPDLYQKTYYVWKITVGRDFDMAKAGMKLNALEPENEEKEGYTFIMWILGEDYTWCPEDSYNDGIYIVQDIPESRTWSSLDDVHSDWPKINLSLSETADSERNTFYIIQKPGENTDLGLGQLHVYTITDSSGVGGGGFRVEKALDADSALAVGTTPIAVTIGGKSYEAVPVHLESFLGHSHLYITAENSTGQLRACISFGMDIYFEGALEGIKTVGPVWNDTNRLFGYDPEFPDFEIVTHDDGSISAYFEDACAIITDTGQGSVCTVSIDLKDGYVITDVHDGAEPFVFLADDSLLYNMWDADGNLLDSDDELDAAGWEGPRSGSSDQVDGTHKTAPGTVHRIATYGRDDVGYENVTYLKQFLDEKGFTAEKLGGFTDYNMYFGKAQYEGSDPAETIRIVFEVTRPEDFRDTSFQVVGRDDIELEAEVLDEEDYNGELYNENVQQLHGEDREVKKVYEITETRGTVAENGIICITISADELDGGNLEDYTVVYFTEGGVPIEVETTYVEGQGLVFTTGHFSTYAVIGKISESGDDGSGENEGSGNSGSTGGNTGGSIGGGGSSAGGSWIPSEPKDDADTDEKALIEAIEALKFKARSSMTTLRGKRAVKITWNVPDDMEYDGFEVFRSTQRYKGFGTKPYFETTRTSYINNKDLKTGTTYYYKVRAFKYVNGRKVYTDWSYKAIRTIKK